MFLFPVVVLMAYGILYIIAPDKALLALENCGNVFLNIAKPLCFVFAIMILLNLFLKPAYIVKFLGKGAGVKGIILSTAAGIISMGPIYVWYPLLKELKEKGATNPFLSIFLYNRAVKPVLLPIMISYFGWQYVVILMILTVLASIVIGYLMGVFVKEQDAPIA